MSLSMRAAYAACLQRGEIDPDPSQAAAVEALARVEGELNAEAEPHFALPFLHRRREAVRGVYLYGPVGRGKSMLMDLFYDSAPVARKRRVHFHAFMGEVHRLIDVWRKRDDATRKAAFGHVMKGDDPIAPVAEHMAEQARLLCFDEFHVTDIADAMILGRLFAALFAQGVTVVATSNRAPDDLYENGLNRQLFLPFIELLKARMEVVEIAGAKDFRLERSIAEQTYFTPIGEESEAAFDALWAHTLDGAEETGATFQVLGHSITLPRAAGSCVRSGFVSLCGSALGAQDYLAIAARFHAVFLEDVPRLGPENRNEAARLTALVDALYEAKALLVMLAEAEPAALYPGGDGAFEFQRTASRLEEMRSAEYVAAARAGMAALSDAGKR